MREMAPDATKVTVLDNYRLQITFKNGEERIFDVAPLLSRKCYSALSSKALFSLASIEYGCVTWPGNIDIDPDWIYEDSVPVSGRAYA